MLHIKLSHIFLVVSFVLFSCEKKQSLSCPNKGKIITYFPYQGLKSHLYIRTHAAIVNLNDDKNTIPYSIEQNMITQLRNNPKR